MFRGMAIIAVVMIHTTLTSILSSFIFLLIIYCVLQRRAPQGKPHNHKPKSRLRCCMCSCFWKKDSKMVRIAIVLF